MAANVYESRREVYVTPFTGAVLKYGFLTNVLSSVGTSCGHVAVDRSNLPTALVFGANAPKPGRASKRRVNGTDSTFYDISRVGALRSDGWSLSNPSIRRGRTSVNSKSVFVTIDGVNYAWRMPTTTYNKVGADRTALGIQDADQNDRDLAWGLRFPKPPKASRFMVGTGGNDVITTFVDPQRADNLPEGWSISGREFVLG